MLFPDLPKDAAALAERCIEMGFSAVKFGYGSFGKDPRHDHALLDAIQGAAGGRAEIMVDAGRVWNAEQAIDRARDLFDHYPIVWIEEPLREDDLDGYEKLAASVPGRFAAGETETTLGPFRELLRRGVKVLQPDVGRAGGLTVCREVSRVAAASGAWCVPHCFGTGVNLAASLQWMSSAEEAPFIEFPLTGSELRNALVPNAPRQVDGWVAVPQSPGLGIGVEESVVRQYRQV